jgi:hypothetical protein
VVPLRGPAQLQIRPACFCAARVNIFYGLGNFFLLAVIRECVTYLFFRELSLFCLTETYYSLIPFPKIGILNKFVNKIRIQTNLEYERILNLNKFIFEQKSNLNKKIKLEQ